MWLSETEMLVYYLVRRWCFLTSILDRLLISLMGYLRKSLGCLLVLHHRFISCIPQLEMLNFEWKKAPGTMLNAYPEYCKSNKEAVKVKLPKSLWSEKSLQVVIHIKGDHYSFKPGSLTRVWTHWSWDDTFLRGHLVRGWMHTRYML